MPTDQPIACTLTAAEMPERLDEIRAIGDMSLLAVEEGESRAVLRFGADPGTRARLEAIVAAESRCCAFLELGLEEGPAYLVLTIGAPAGGEPIMHELVEAFRGRGSGSRLLSSPPRVA